MTLALKGCLLTAVTLLALPAAGDDGCSGAVSALPAAGVQVAQVQNQAIDAVKEKAAGAVQDAAKEQMMKGAMPGAAAPDAATGTTPAVPSAPAMPGTPATPGMPAAPSAPGLPAAPAMPSKDALPQTPKIPGQ